MRLQIDKLGKVSVTVEENFWDINKDYNKLTILNIENSVKTYISRIPVPAGTPITNKAYWIPIGGDSEGLLNTVDELVRAMNEDVVKVITQELTEEQKSTARTNIGALSENLIDETEFNNIFNP